MFLFITSYVFMNILLAVVCDEYENHINVTSRESGQLARDHVTEAFSMLTSRGHGHKGSVTRVQFLTLLRHLSRHTAFNNTMVGPSVMLAWWPNTSREEAGMVTPQPGYGVDCNSVALHGIAIWYGISIVLFLQCDRACREII